MSMGKYTIGRSLRKDRGGNEGEYYKILNIVSTSEGDIFIVSGEYGVLTAYRKSTINSEFRMA